MDVDESRKDNMRNYCTAAGFFLLATTYFLMGMPRGDFTAELSQDIFGNITVINFTAVLLIAVGIALVFLRKRTNASMIFIIIGSMAFFFAHAENEIIHLTLGVFILVLMVLIILLNEKNKWVYVFILAYLGIFSLVENITPEHIAIYYYFVFGAIMLYFSIACASDRFSLPLRKYLTVNDDGISKLHSYVFGFAFCGFISATWATYRLLGVPEIVAYSIDSVVGLLLMFTGILGLLLHEGKFTSMFFFLMGILVYIEHIEAGLSIFVTGFMCVALGVFAFIKKNPHILLGLAIVIYGIDDILTVTIPSYEMFPIISGVLNLITTTICLYTAFMLAAGKKRFVI